MYWLKRPSYLLRINTCKSCPNFSDNACKLCGCNIFAKAILPFTECKENRWAISVETQIDKPNWFNTTKET